MREGRREAQGGRSGDMPDSPDDAQVGFGDGARKRLRALPDTPRDLAPIGLVRAGNRLRITLRRLPERLRAVPCLPCGFAVEKAALA